MLPAVRRHSGCQTKRGRRSGGVVDRKIGTQQERRPPFFGMVFLRACAELAIRRQRFERAERDRWRDNGRLIRGRGREWQAGHGVIGLVARRSLWSVRRSTVTGCAARWTTGTTAKAAAAATLIAVPGPPTAAAGEARHHRGQSQHGCETFHSGGIPFREDSKSGRHSPARQRLGSKEGGREKLQRGDGTLTIRRKKFTEVRQAGRDSRTRRQTGQDVF